MGAKQVAERVRAIIEALDGVGAAGRRVATAAVPVAALAMAACPAYGMPWADYEVSGTVVSALTGDPVEGLQVEFQGSSDVATTGSDGSWSLVLEAGAFYFPDCPIGVRDVDGAANGEFEDLDATVSLERTARGSGDWYEGRYEAHGVVLEVEPVAD